MDGFNVIDAIVAVVLVLSAVLAYARGLTREVMSIVGWIGAAIVGFIFADEVAPLMREVPVLGGFLAGSCELTVLVAFTAVFAARRVRRVRRRRRGDAANFVALGLHALQHRGQEAGGIVTHDPVAGFNSARRFGYVRDNFTSASVMETLPGAIGIGHVRYSTAGIQGPYGDPRRPALLRRIRHGRLRDRA
jgi:hypothetical protein